MKFKAKIKYNLTQSRLAKQFGDKNIIDCEIEFTFQDIVGYSAYMGNRKVSFSPLFTARELLIPWLQSGNIPELIE